MTLAELGVKITANIKDLQKNLGVAKSSLKGFGDKAGSLGTKLTAGLTLPIVAVGASALKTASDFEQLQVRLNTLIGDADEGAKAFKRLQEFSAGTPFQLDALVKANNTLLGFGMSSEEAFTSLRQLGDVASATGADLQSIAVAFGQSSAEGTLFTRDIRQFINQGVPAVDLLADAMGVARSEVFSLAEQGKISFKILQQAISNATSAGGKFEGATEAQAKTISGLFSTLKDNISLALGNLGNSIAEALDLKNVVTTLTAYISAITKTFSNLSRDAQTEVLKVAGLFAIGGPILLGIALLIKGILLIGAPIIAFVALVSTIGVIFASAFGEAGSITGAFKGIFAEMLRFVLKGVKNLFGVLSNVPGAIGEAFKLANGKIIQTIGDLEETTESFNPIESIKTQFQKTFSALKGVFGDFQTNLEEEMVAPTEEATKDVEQSVTDLKDSFSDLVRSVANSMAQYSSIIIKSGLEAFTQSLFNAGEYNTEELKMRRNSLKQQEYALDDSLKRQKESLQNALDDGEITQSEYNNRLRLLQEENALAQAQIQRDLVGVEQEFNRQRRSAFRTAMDDMVIATKQAVKQILAQLAKLAIIEGIMGLLTLGGAQAGKGIGGFLLKAIGGARANGGSVMAGTPYLVGEVGPELFVPNSKGSVMSNRDMMSGMGSGSNNMNLTGQFVVKGTDLVLALDEANYSLGK